MNLKTKLLRLIQEYIEDEYQKASEIAKSARNSAIDNEIQQEGKYDTRRIEASYLAGAQAKRVAILEIDLELIKVFELKDEVIHKEAMVGSLVKCNDGGKIIHYFISPTSGGMSIQVNGETISVISVNSPLATEILQLEAGDSFEIESPSGDREIDIISLR